MHTYKRFSLWAFVTSVILLSTPLLIVIDTFNGVLIRDHGISGLSQAVKVSYLILLALYAMRGRKGLMVVFACILSNLIFAIVHFFPSGNLEVLWLDAQWLLRFNIIWIGFHVFRNMQEKGVIDDMWLYRAFTFVSFVLAANIVLGTLGFGYSQYGKYSDSEQIGAVGFIYAGNEMSFLILLCQIVVCSHLYFREKMTQYLLASAIFFALAIFKATKVAMLGSFIVLISFPAIEVVRFLCSYRTRIWRAVSIGGFSILVTIISLPWVIQLIESTGILGRMQYFLREYGVIFMIFSGREVFSADFISSVWSNYSFTEYLVGPGRYEMLFRLGHPVEIDILDIAGAFGLLGVALYYGFFLWRLLLALRGTNRNDLRGRNLTTIVLLSLLLLVSLTAGHVIYSGLAAPYIALAIGALSISSPSLKLRSENLTGQSR